MDMICRKRFALVVLTLLLTTLASLAQSPAPGEGFLGGKQDAPIRIDLFSDYQCPACRGLYLETIRPVLKEYCEPNKVCVVYHDFPLPNHQYAREAARYSQAAQKLGRKQWLAVVDALYTRQPQWSQDGKLEATVASAVSPEELQLIKKGLKDPSVEQAIDGDIALGKQRKVESTPTFFVYAIGREQKVVGGIPYPVLKDFFDRIVK